MKTPIGCLLLLASTLFAREPSLASWTPVGVWNAEHAGWTDSICINTDGTYYRKSNGEVGKWYLLCDGKTRVPRSGVESLWHGDPRHAEWE
jgi:hypothetical protein